jgi:hypothetical protein
MPTMGRRIIKWRNHMGQARDKIEALRGMVVQAERNGVLSAPAANAFWDIVGDRPVTAVPARPIDREVTITLRVSGLDRLPAGADREIERALAGVASRAGATVTMGSVRVS